MAPWQLDTRDQLRREFDAAIHDLNQLRHKQNLTTGFAAKIGDSVFDAGYRALEDGAAAAGTQGAKDQPRQSRLHVVSAPVGSGKTSFTIALITACVRLSAADTKAPYGCVWVVDQMHTAEEMYVTLNALLPGKVPASQRIGGEISVMPKRKKMTAQDAALRMAGGEDFAEMFPMTTRIGIA